MHKFTFHNPTRIVFGAGVVDGIGAEAVRFGRVALLVTGGGSLRRSGVHERVLRSLAAAGVEVAEFSGVTPNPTLSHLRRGVAAAKAARAEVVVAVGGGSVLDEAKAIAAGAVLGEDVWEFISGRVQLADALPVVTAPTVAAAGSEMNGIFVITNDETRAKNGVGHDLLRPRVSLMDPALTTTLPLDYTALAAVDIVSHATEGYLTQSGDLPLQDGLVESLARTVRQTMARLLADPADVDARADMMWASTLAWNGILSAGIDSTAKPCHMLGHPVSAMHDTPHGATLALVTPAWMQDQAERDPRRIAKFGRAVLAVEEEEDRTAALATASALRGWYRKIGAPLTFAEAGIAAPDLDALAERSLAIARAKGSAAGWTAERIKGILSRSL